MEKLTPSDRDKYIKKFKDLPPDHAYDAFKNGYYYEATGVLHGFMEMQLRHILLAFSTLNLQNDSKDIWDTNEKLNYSNLNNVLYILQLITKDQFVILTSLNSLRNDIIHKYFHDPYEKYYFGVSHKKFHSIFKSSYNLSYDFMSKIHGMYERYDNTL
ncbi:MAG: hypothetical protein COB60_12555 [Flavobacteriaceae bacterium]|nr:MAG: hypothetical protein COB60_12555 [Flavobacteriaceae bacterium]